MHMEKAAYAAVLACLALACLALLRVLLPDVCSFLMGHEDCVATAFDHCSIPYLLDG